MTQRGEERERGKKKKKKEGERRRGAQKERETGECHRGSFTSRSHLDSPSPLLPLRSFCSSAWSPAACSCAFSKRSFSPPSSRSRSSPPPCPLPAPPFSAPFFSLFLPPTPLRPLPCAALLEEIANAIREPLAAPAPPSGPPLLPPVPPRRLPTPVAGRGKGENGRLVSPGSPPLSPGAFRIRGRARDPTPPSRTKALPEASEKFSRIFEIDARPLLRPFAAPWVFWRFCFIPPRPAPPLLLALPRAARAARTRPQRSGRAPD